MDPLPPFVTHSRNLSVVFVTYWVTPPPPSMRTSYKYRPPLIPAAGSGRQVNHISHNTLGHRLGLWVAAWLDTGFTENIPSSTDANSFLSQLERSSDQSSLFRYPFQDLKSKMPQLVFHYFGMPFWRAEVCRLALHLGKVGSTILSLISELDFVLS